MSYKSANYGATEAALCRARAKCEKRLGGGGAEGDPATDRRRTARVELERGLPSGRRGAVAEAGYAARHADMDRFIATRGEAQRLAGA